MGDTSVTKGAMLRLGLCEGSAALPESGKPIELPGGARAVVELSSERASLDVSLPDTRARAELRWLVDQAVRKVAGLVEIGHIDLHAERTVDDDTVQTIALDLHNRTRGQLTVHDREQVSLDAARVGALEDLYRSWVDEDPDTRTSLAIARDVQAWAAGQSHVSTEILAEDELRELGLRLLLTVGRGGEISPPRLVIAEYRPDGSRSAPIMLLGKGITFDTGGINVKPYDAFVSMMKNDMAGAALAYTFFRALVEGGYDQPVVLVVPTCENAIGSRAMKPGAVVKSYRGHTVRIDHTDAEGRLILADGLAYGADRFAPRRVISFATLTTAALIAYGPYATPVHFADSILEGRLRAGADATGDDLHFMPERIWHSEANRDREATLRNTARLPGNANRAAGSRNAAHFLRHFTEAELCHLDIFASTWNWAGDAPGAHSGATGAPLRPLLHAYNQWRRG